MSEIEQLRAEIERMRPVFDAAREYRAAHKPFSAELVANSRVDLLAAVDKAVAS